VESDARLLRVNFELLGERLLAFVRSRIKNGEYSERGLARILGVSQPQMHNVLKGARGLRPALADRFLRKFGITALDLFSDAELNDAISTRMTTRIGARSTALDSIGAFALRFQAGDSAMRKSVDKTDGDGEDLRRWRKPASKSARLNLRHGEKVS
jgi:plasmid maintenance system antidote protein VapI